MKNTWCCEGLKHAFEERLSRGIFVYAEPPIPEYNVDVTYWLGMRSIDFHDQDRFMEHSSKQEAPPGFPLPQTLQAWLPIKYCPWCGKKLEKYYKKNYELLTDKELSNEHQFGA